MQALGVTCQHGSAVVLRNHGLLGRRHGACALRRLYMLERACEVEIIARGLDEEPAPIDDEVVRRLRGERARQQRASPVRRLRLEGSASPDRRQGHRLAAVTVVQPPGPRLPAAHREPENANDRSRRRQPGSSPS